MPHARVPKVGPADRFAFSPSEISALLGVSPAFVADLLKERTLRSVKIGGRRIITAGALAELLGEAELPTLAMAISNGAPAIGEPPPSTEATATLGMPSHQRDQPRRNNGSGSRAAAAVDGLLAKVQAPRCPAPVITREQLDGSTAADRCAPPAVLVSASTPPERRDIVAAPPRRHARSATGHIKEEKGGR